MAERKHEPVSTNAYDGATPDELLALLDVLAQATEAQELKAQALIRQAREMLDDACERRKECAELRRHVYQLQAHHAQLNEELKPNTLTRRREVM